MAGVSSTAREPSKNENLQQMYERVLGNTAPVDNTDLRNNPFLFDQGVKTNLSADQSVQSDVGTLLHNPTINQQIRNRMIVKNMDGFPMIKTYKETFKPASLADAKNDVKNDKFTMHENDYNLTR